jgi:hypothetical protein
MFVRSSGQKVGFSALEFEQLARAYAQQKKLPFDLEGAQKTIWVDTRGSKIIARAYFDLPSGQILVVEIDRDGRVADHTVASSRR